MRERIRGWVQRLVGQTPAQRRGREADVAADPAHPGTGDDPFVGRISPDTTGDGGDTAAAGGGETRAPRRTGRGRHGPH